MIVSARHLVLRTSSLYRQRYVAASLSSDNSTDCKSRWIKASAKCPECNLNVNVLPSCAAVCVQDGVVHGVHQPAGPRGAGQGHDGHPEAVHRLPHQQQAAEGERPTRGTLLLGEDSSLLPPREDWVSPRGRATGWLKQRNTK